MRALLTPPKSRATGSRGSLTNWRRRGLEREKLRGKDPERGARPQREERPRPRGCAPRERAGPARARAAGRLTWHSQPRATRRRRWRGARSVQSRYDRRGAQDAGRRVKRVRRVGRVGSRRYGGLGARLGVHTRLHRDSPSTWLPGSRRRRGLEIFRGKMATTAFSFGTSLDGKRQLVPGDSGPGKGVSVESEHSRFGFEAGLCQVALCHVAACS